MLHSVQSVQISPECLTCKFTVSDGKFRVSDCSCSPGACLRSSVSNWEPGRNLMQPFSSVESDTASQQVAAEMSDVKGGQYAMS